MQIAPHLDAEIVSADSRQIYHYMDIGTAKPTLSERAAVVHHLIDLAYPDEPYSVVEFRRDAKRVLGEIRRQGRRAILVGGSPHYIEAIVDGLRPAPRHPTLRGWLDRTDARPGGEGRLDLWLDLLDPVASGEIDHRNRRRVLRAIEGMGHLGKNGLRYPFPPYGAAMDPSFGMAKSYG